MRLPQVQRRMAVCTRDHWKAGRLCARPISQCSAALTTTVTCRTSGFRMDRQGAPTERRALGPSCFGPTSILLRCCINPGKRRRRPLTLGTLRLGAGRPGSGPQGERHLVEGRGVGPHGETDEGVSARCAPRWPCRESAAATSMPAPGCLDAGARVQPSTPPCHDATGCAARMSDRSEIMPTSRHVPSRASCLGSGGCSGFEWGQMPIYAGAALPVGEETDGLVHGLRRGAWVCVRLGN